MPEISKTITIDMAHRIPLHDSKCRNMHGHTYKIELFAIGPLQNEGSSEGMVVDFSFLKELLMEIDKKFDHGCCLDRQDTLVKFAQEHEWAFAKLVVVPFVPTAENLAKEWLRMCTEYLFRMCIKDRRLGLVRLTRIKVWETPTSMAEVTADEL